MSNKEDIKKMFSAYFDGLKTITDYFGVEDFNPEYYEISCEEDTEWKIKDGFIFMYGDKKGSKIHGLYRKEFHTLVLFEQWGECYAMIFDNDQEIR